MSATQAATSAAVGGSVCRCRSCSRTDPMSMECAASRRPPASPGPARSSRRRCRRPAPARPAHPQVADRAGEGERAPPRRPTAPRARRRGGRATPVGEDRGVRGVAGGRGGAEADPGDVVARRSARRTRRARRTPAPAPRRRAARCGRRPGRAGPSAVSRTATSGRSPISSLMVLVPQSIAAIVLTRSSGGHARRRGPRPTSRPSAVEHLVAERVHAAALGQRLAGQHVQALDPVGHAAGGDPLDLGHVEPGPRRARRAPRGSARGRRGRPRPARGRCRAASCISFISPEPSSVPMREAARGQVR